MRTHCLRWALVASTLCLGTATADVASEARFFDDLGRRAYAAGNFDSALESLQLAYEIAPSSGLLYNIALCADLAGRDDLAFSLYREYLVREDKDSARRADAEQRSERLKGKLALVEITSDPPGALVYVDRKELGQFGVTPVTIAAEPGDRKLHVEREGFVPAIVPVHAENGATVQANASLVPIYGELAVEVTPPVAKLQISRQGTTSAATLSGTSGRVPVGRYRIKASAPGYVTSEQLVVVRQAETTRLDLELVPLPQKTGRLLVNASTAGAEVFIDGKRVAVTPATLPALSVGAHQLEVKDGQRVVKRAVKIQAERTTYVVIDLKKLQVKRDSQNASR